MFEVLVSGTFFTGFIMSNSPGMIIGPIANVLGFVINFIFNFVYMFVHNGSFAITIVLFTIFVKLVLFPLSIKQQKSMVLMRRLQPEIQKIQEKYKGNKDPEIQRKMQAETSEVYRKHKASPFSGCFPLLIQMPILYALFYVLRESAQYITVMGNIYVSIADIFNQFPNWNEVFSPIAAQVYPANVTTVINLDVVSEMRVFISRLTPEHWNVITSSTPASLQGQLTELLAQKNHIENFFSINLIQNSGTAFPGILIPLLSGVTTFFSTKLTNKNNPSMNDGGQAATQMKVMNYIMPVMMVFFAVPLPAGLGLYWTMSNVCQLAQQLALNKMYPYDAPVAGEITISGKKVTDKSETGDKADRKKLFGKW